MLPELEWSSAIGSYRRVGTTYPSHLPGSSSFYCLTPDNGTIVFPKRRQLSTNLRCLKFRKIKDLTLQLFSFCSVVIRQQIRLTKYTLKRSSNLTDPEESRKDRLALIYSQKADSVFLPEMPQFISYVPQILCNFLASLRADSCTVYKKEKERFFTTAFTYR
jgi:hypothetical protein